MSIKFTMRTDGLDDLKYRFALGCSRAEHTVAVRAASDTEKYVPMLTGSLRQRTLVAGNEIIYPGPYARYLYYGKYMVDAKTGAGAMHFFDRNGNEHIKFRKGARLVPTDRDLVFHKAGTRSHWFDYSESQNLKKWEKTAKKAVLDEI